MNWRPCGAQSGVFEPTLSREAAAQRMAQWEHAVRQTVL